MVKCLLNRSVKYLLDRYIQTHKEGSQKLYTQLKVSDVAVVVVFGTRLRWCTGPSLRLVEVRCIDLSVKMSLYNVSLTVGEFERTPHRGRYRYGRV